MFAVEKYAQVRQLVFIDGVSRREVARLLGLSRDTVTKMCRYSEPPGYRRTKAIERPKLGAFVGVINAILEADEQAPPKQRHTAKRIWQRLRDEYGFTGGYTTVKDYVRQALTRRREVFVPLAHPPGHAQIDFGESIAEIGGVRGKTHVFCMHLPYSDAIFLKAYPAETTEALLDGVASGFAFFGGVPLSVLLDNTKLAVVRIKRIAGPAHGVFMRLHAYPIGVRGDFNGLQTASTYELRENPFVIFVGSFGKAHGGGLAPSHFSDIATGADGKLIPHVLGPGQLRLDGKELNGTSFSSPFLTALYATRVGYNIKNLIERTSNHARLNAGVQRFEGSRWGTPDAAQISKDLKAITGPTKIDGISQRIEGDNLVIKFSISRCCMERLTWFVYARLYDPESHDPLRIPGTDKPVSGFATLYSEKPDYVRYPVEVRIPIKGLDSIKGKPVDVKFDLLVRSWRTSPLGRMPVDEPPLYRIAALGLTGPALAAKRPDDGATINDSDILREVRDRLYELNFDPGPLNGPFGEPVRQAIRNFETSHKMAQTGVPTQALLQKLRDLGEQKPWGTIAYDKSKNKWGMSWNHTSRKEAVLNARTRCGDSKQCAAEISFFGNECGAFAYSERGWSLASRTDIQRARDAALSDCRKRGKSCAIVAAVCSDGSHKFPASH